MSGKSSFLKSLSERSLIALLIFSFVCTLLGFGVAYNEHRSLLALSDKYDLAIEKIDECQSEISALSEKVAYIETTTSTAIIEESFISEDIYHTPDVFTNATVPSATDNNTRTETTQSTTVKASSGQYYVTQSGSKYHISSCSYLSKSRIAVSLETIRSKGYTPCSRCIK